MTHVVLGIDPGVTGAVSVVAIGGGRLRLVAVIDIPILGEDNEREVHPSLLTFIQDSQAKAAYIERARWLPGQGAAMGLLYGTINGALRMAVRGCLIPLTRIEPTAWKRAHEIPPQGDMTSAQVKALSIARAIHLFPDHAESFSRSSDHNRAESALIGAYGAKLLSGG